MLRMQTGLDKTPCINRTLAVHDPSSVVSSDATGMLKGRRGQPDIFVAER